MSEDDPQHSAPPSSPLSPADSSAFAFDRPDEDWMARVRQADPPVDLGRVGRYELVEVAGVGGQGIVYRAVETGTGRSVALKRILGGSWAGEGERARFAREIEVDAALRHPNIVTVYGIEAAEGQPVLAMEWVDGEPIDHWAGRPAGWPAAPRRDSDSPDPSRSDGPPAPRPVREVLDVFLKVCDGVQHAHMRGVIHRDLKPSNILVDAAGEPRVLDFGLAKLSGTDPVSRSRLTATGGFLGTLAYAAPEQVRGERDGVDVRTDVYALGAILYQCLTGRVPHESRGDLAALTRLICETNPPRPSSLRPGLDADLDAITARAMTKERSQRYSSVEALGADIRRHLAHEPVEARGPGAWYLRAERQRALAESVHEFMHQVLTVEDPTGDLKWREVLDNAAARIDGAFPGQPLAEAEVRNMVQAMYLEIGLYDRALAHAQLWHSILERELGPSEPRTLLALSGLANIHRVSLRFSEAERMYRRLLDLRRRRFGPEHELVTEAMNNLALVLGESGRPAEAEPLLREVVRIGERTMDSDALVTSVAWNNLALVLEDMGNPAEAAEIWRRGLEARERTDGPDHEKTIGLKYNLAGLIETTGQVEEAEAMMRDALERARRTLSDGHPMTVTIGSYLGEMRARRGDAVEGEALLRAALAASLEHLTPDHPSTIKAGVKLGSFLIERGAFDESEAVLLESLESSQRTLGATHRQTQRVSQALAKLYDAWGKPDKAAELHTRLEAGVEATTPAGP